MEQTKIQFGVAGSGTMGMGIAYLASLKNYPIVLFDVNETALNKARNEISELLEKQISKGKIQKEEKDLIIERINFTSKPEEFKNSKIIIEAIIEDINIKKDFFTEVSKLVNENCILATNTSSLSVTSLSSACDDPGRFIGIHFFNPAYILPLVEIVPAISTSKKTIEDAKNIIENLGKTTVIARDIPGFIVNRVARPFYGEALRILEEGIADVATIDWAMKEFGGFKMGPFELMDLIGNDINYKVTETVFKEYYFDPRYKPSIIQKRLVEANMFGKKNGRGFYDYTNPENNPKPNKNNELGREIFFRILTMLINEAADAVLFNVASVEDIDLAMTKGVNYPKGLLKWADEIGLMKILDRVTDLYEQYNEDRYRPSMLIKKLVRENQKFHKANPAEVF